MKKIFIISLFLAAILALSAVAVQVDSSVTIGSDSQRRSNPRADEDEDQEIYITKTFQIENDLNEPLNITNIEFPTANKYDISLPGTTFPIELAAANSTGTKIKTVTIESKIPKDLTSFWENDPNQEKEQIGDLVIKTAAAIAGVESTTVKLYLQAENFLEISKIYISVNDGRRKSYNDGDDIEDLRPGDTIQIIVKLENNYRDSDPEDIDFEDVEVEIEADDSEIDDLDDDDEIDVNADSTEEVEFEVVELEDDIDEDDYDITITVRGDDDNGAFQGMQWTLTLEVEKDRDEIAIKNFEKEIELSCNQRSFPIEFTLKNIGKDDQRRVEVRVSGSDFEYTRRETNIELDERDDEDFTFIIPIPSDIRVGFKNINIESFYDRTDLSHSEAITIKVPDCLVKEPEEEEEEEPELDEEEEEELVIIQPSDEEEDQDLIIAGGQIIETVEPSFIGSTTYLVILILAIIITVACVGILAVVLIKANKPKI